MIKLKNLWKVALATMAMSAMLVACDTGSTDEEETEGKHTAGTGVYELKAPKSKIGKTFNSWSGFGVLLLKEDQVEEFSKDLYPQRDGTSAKPMFQLTTAGKNLKFPKYATAKGNAEVTSGDDVLSSAWATLTDNDFTFYVDMSAIKREEVKILANGGETQAKGSSIDTDLTGYKPYVVALFDEPEEDDKNPVYDVADVENGVVKKTYAKYAAYCNWGAGIWEMTTSTATKPTSFGEFIAEADVSAIDKTTTSQAGAEILFPGANVAVSGADVNDKGLHVTFKDGVGTAEFTIGENPKFDAWGQGGDFFAAWFQFWAGDDKELAAVNKQYYVADKAVTTLGKAVELTDDGKKGGNLIVTDLNAAGTYVVTIDALADIPTITVTKKVN